MSEVREQIDQLNACAQWIETRRSRDIDRDMAEVMRNSAESLDSMLAVIEAAKGLIGSSVQERSTVSSVLAYPKWRVHKLNTALGAVLEEQTCEK